jgi:Pyrimidine dimer DNA glycosylase
MRLWSLHPRYLDRQGLLACWREALLAKHVLEERTKGYKHHPQLHRFFAHKNPVAAIHTYLFFLYQEARQRGYHFNYTKIGRQRTRARLAVTNGQMSYELEHLREKIRRRNRTEYARVIQVKNPVPHPLFRVIIGAVEIWEKSRGKKD